MATGKQIKHYRIKLGWKLKHLSLASDVDIGTISALETRDSIRSEFFSPIAKAFGLTLEQLQDSSNDYQLNPPVNPLTDPVNEPLVYSTHSIPIVLQAHNITALPSPAPKPDKWIARAVDILTQLNESQRAACVVQLEMYLAAVAPPQVGQTL